LEDGQILIIVCESRYSFNFTHTHRLPVGKQEPFCAAIVRQAIKRRSVVWSDRITFFDRCDIQTQRKGLF